MTTMKYKLENFNGSRKFSLWKGKMKNILIQKAINGALDKVLLEELKEGEKKIKMKKACSYIELYLADKVLCQVQYLKITKEIWEG